MQSIITLYQIFEVLCKACRRSAVDNIVIETHRYADIFVSFDFFVNV